jgi:hypothetical protein
MLNRADDTTVSHFLHARSVYQGGKPFFDGVPLPWRNNRDFRYAIISLQPEISLKERCQLVQHVFTVWAFNPSKF